jgi:hypothetical protein
MSKQWLILLFEIVFMTDCSVMDANPSTKSLNQDEVIEMENNQEMDAEESKSKTKQVDWVPKDAVL